MRMTGRPVDRARKVDSRGCAWARWEVSTTKLFNTPWSYYQAFRYEAAHARASPGHGWECLHLTPV